MLFKHVEVIFHLPLVGFLVFVRFLDFVHHFVSRVVIIDFDAVQLISWYFSARRGYEASCSNGPRITSSDVASILMPLANNHNFRWQMKVIVEMGARDVHDQ
jgi:hypothetical protein